MNLKYYAAALFAFVIWGTFSLVLRPLDDFPAIEILLYRVLFAVIVIWTYNLLFYRRATQKFFTFFKEANRRERRKIITNYFVSAVMLSLNWYLFIFVMNTISVNATSLAYLICPILTTVLATIFLNEKLKAGQWFAVALSAFSCILLSLGHFIDLFYSLMIALSYAIYLILQKLNTKTDKFLSLSVHITICAIFLAPSFLFTGAGVSKTMLFYELVLVIAVVFTILPLFLNGYALKGLSSSLVGILLYVNPILSFLIAILYFNEQMTWIQGVAYSLIFVSVALFNLIYFSSRKRQLAIDPAS